MRPSSHIVAGAALLAVGSPAASQASQFDLVCSGERDTWTFAGDRIQPYEKRYRVDLDRMTWCEDACDQLFTVQFASQTYLSLHEFADSDGITPAALFNSVDLETGAHRIEMSFMERARREETLVNESWQGTCQRAQFTEIPTSP